MTPHWEYWTLAALVVLVLTQRLMAARTRRRARRSKFYCNPFLDPKNNFRPNTRKGWA